jgi:hypothetical protein
MKLQFQGDIALLIEIRNRNVKKFHSTSYQIVFISLSISMNIKCKNTFVFTQKLFVFHYQGGEYQKRFRQSVSA